MRQRLGQHFLRDQKVVKTILAAAELSPEDTALEIGPGRGVVTSKLVDFVKRLVAVEMDDELAPHLVLRFAHRPSVQIIHADILKVDLDVLARDPSQPDAPPKPMKVIGNLPYSITSPIFEKFLVWEGWQTGVFLIQREVAERIISKEGSKVFGILSLAIQLFADAEIVARVKPGAFLPPPRVHSCVIRLRKKVRPLVAHSDIPAFFDLAHGAFAHRRKTIANSLAFHCQCDRSVVEKWLARQGVDSGVRAETLAPSEYAKMAGPWSIFRREINLTTDTATSTIRRE